MTTQTPLAILVQAETSYEQHHIRAYVMLPQSDGELHSPDRYSGPAARRFAGFVISAYVGNGFSLSPDNNPDEVWGWSYRYDNVSVDDHEQATEMARVLRTLENGLRKIEDDEGYTHDLAGYIMRIARILKIKDIRVRNAQEQYGYTGERYRKSNGSHLQWWISNARDLARKGSWDRLTRVR